MLSIMLSCLSLHARHKAQNGLHITWRPAVLAGECSETSSIFAKGLL